MDKSWMLAEKGSVEFVKGVGQFMDFAFEHAKGNEIHCPCTKCNNVKPLRKRTEVYSHLIWFGIVQNYTTWDLHGEGNLMSETPDLGDDMQGLVWDALGPHHDTNDGSREDLHDEPNEEASNFFRLLRDAEQNLYPGCENYTKLSFIVSLLNIKCINGWSNKSFDSLLDLLVKAFPIASIPNSFYEAKKYIRNLGLNYKKIDACQNDCILFWKENANLTHCPIYGAPRWKHHSDEGNDLDVNSRNDRKIPEKTLRYFPLIPRLQRLFMSEKTASSMRWHHECRIDDGVLRHIADTEVWKSFDRIHQKFSSEPRNVRIAIASDGMNPFGNMSNPHSTWPVVIMIYNLPPWMCLKSSYFILSMIIPGPKSPGNNLDVYLQPLVEELKELWLVGVETYDASKKQNFQMHAAVLCTISDYPALAMLSGWSTKGELACICCNNDPCSLRLRHGGKWCYMDHRRFLPEDHKWRNQKKSFNGEKEKRLPPKQLTGYDILEQFTQIDNVTFGNSGSKRQRTECNFKHNWKKKSIFYVELPYVRTILQFHNVDVMHVEKNVCDIVINTIMNVADKTKDGLKARQDLQAMGIRKELHPIKEGEKYKLPPACYTMSKKEKDNFCTTLKDVKVPDGYSSNLSRCVNLKERKIIGLKSHDCHVLLEQLLPLAVRGQLPKDVSEPLIELCLFFKVLCTKVLRVDDLDELQKKIAVTLCKLERIFPPSFFVVMMHLPIHLATQAKIAGPVQYRWMYPIERYMHRLKKYVRNKACPEGSMAEGYIAEECLTFCSRYLNSTETRFNQAERNDDVREKNSREGLSVFTEVGQGIGARFPRQLSAEELAQARLYVLENCEEVWPHEDIHKKEIESASPRDIDRRHNATFPEWFERRISRMHKKAGQVSEQLLSLARGPCREVVCFRGYIVNGYRFHTKACERRRKTQNSGVSVKGDDSADGIDYYGVLTDVIEMKYVGGYRVVLFKCNWWDVTHPGGIKKDEYGFTYVNINKKGFVSEPFVIASQAEQVFYVKDVKDPNWHLVVKTQPRNFYDMPKKGMVEDESTTDNEPFQANDSYNSIGEFPTFQVDDNDTVAWNRNDLPVEYVDIPKPTNQIGTQVDDIDAINDGDSDVMSDNDSEHMMCASNSDGFTSDSDSDVNV